MGASQLEFDLDGLASTPFSPSESHGSIDDQFASFHKNNPHVYQLLVTLARRAKSRGRNRIGIKMLYEVARWHFYLNAKDEDGYTLNNNYTSRYARLIEEKEPDLQGMFEFRKLRTE
jgi:hypothetical protein